MGSLRAAHSPCPHLEPCQGPPRTPPAPPTPSRSTDRPSTASHTPLLACPLLWGEDKRMLHAASCALTRGCAHCTCAHAFTHHACIHTQKHHTLAHQSHSTSCSHMHVCTTHTHTLPHQHQCMFMAPSRQHSRDLPFRTQSSEPLPHALESPTLTTHCASPERQWI